LYSQPTLNLNSNAEFSRVLSSDLKRAKWLDNETTDLGLHRHPTLGLDKAEVITAFCSMLHGPLNKVYPTEFNSIKSIIEVLDDDSKHMAIADSIAQLFLERFNPHLKPALSEEAFNTRSNAISAKIALIQKEEAVALLNKMLQGVKSTLRTNFYNDGRYALSMRMDPTIMATGNIGVTADKPLPFGVFFVHGRHFNGFHNRFRDIARGGLRIVTPNNSDSYAQESARQYDEVYGLSHAQQLKNKDIPEGGAKGVILVNAPAIEASARPFAMRKAIKAFTDSMLDLMVKDSVKNLVDHYKKEELIYFGPDEQVIPYDIEWIIGRAAVRGYPIPDALMSSKQANGINHKDYGVTSEGIAVYLDVALRRSLGINPDKQPFTVKVTGGPDGDVAGNLIKIMFRDYGDNAKVVGVADGTWRVVFCCFLLCAGSVSVEVQCSCSDIIQVS
jgi:glutamate dehydrogenase